MRPQPRLIRWLVINLRSLIKKIFRCPLYPTNHTDQTFVFNQAGICFLKQPWIQIRRQSHPKAVFVFWNSNFKFYTNLGLPVRSKNRFLFILDTGATFIIMWWFTWNKIRNPCNIRFANSISHPTFATQGKDCAHLWDHYHYGSDRDEHGTHHFPCRWMTRNLRHTRLWLLQSTCGNDQAPLSHRRDGWQDFSPYRDTTIEGI